jgi:hypothetical protein
MFVHCIPPYGIRICFQTRPTIVASEHYFLSGTQVVESLFVLDLLTLVEGRQTGPLNRRNMDENVLAAALRLNEPVTFGRVEPLHDTGRHRSLSPFWNFNDTGTPHRIQDVARHARPYCLLAISKKPVKYAHRHRES